jgi:ribonucleoside-diphosphate reductase beta chain
MKDYNSVVRTHNLVPGIQQQKIFMGEYSGFQRYDQPKYTFAVNIEEKMRNSFWNPKEISLVSDRIKFPDLPEFIQEIETEILLFQTLMDSGNNRGIDEVLSAMTTSPEFEAMFKTQAYFELLHSFSYSHILREVFPDATAVFDSLKDRTEIHNRINKEIECFNKVAKLTNLDEINGAREDIKNNVLKYIDRNKIEDQKTLMTIWDIFNISDNTLKLQFNADISEVEQKKIILELIVRIYALESLKFYISFLVTYIINNSYNNKIQGIARIIKLINFDEDMHVLVMSDTLDALKTEQSEGFSELMNSEWYTNLVVDIFKEVVEDELTWGQHLLSFGPIPTLTMGVMDNFIKYYANARVKVLIGETIYDGAKKTDVEQWFENYKDINKDNTAQQEAEATNYNIGILKNDVIEGIIEKYNKLYRESAEANNSYNFSKRRKQVTLRKD